MITDVFTAKPLKKKTAINKALMNKSILLICVSTLSVLVMACEAKVGSERWCEEMSEKAKGDWTFNQTTDYAKHCILPKD